MRFKALVRLATLFPTAIALSLASAQAAPQILGLIASTEPVPMTCAGGTCTAELSSVCLQERRPTPPTGTAYRSAKGLDITLAVTGADGVTRRQRVEAALSYESLRQYTAVKVSLPEATVRRLGGGAATLAVGPMASIVPVPIAGDTEPLSADEIANYTGPLRAMAEDAFRLDGGRVDATRLLSRMINRLPEGSTAGIEAASPLVQQTVRSDVAAGTQTYVERAIGNCREALRIGVQPDLRSCLMYEHDYLSGENTQNAWEAMKLGS